MCGIVGYVGQRSAREIILAGLERLEYRGYDSAGLSVLEDGRLDAVRAVGNLSHLRAAVGLDDAAGDAGGGLAVAAPPATTGIGHTRWATHGRVTEENAHPHYDTEDRVHVVVNGIVENYLELKQQLMADGAVFTSGPPTRSSAATTRSSPPRPTRPASSSAPARSARSWWAAATASSSSHPRSPPSSPTRATCS
jgi:glucosamine 6-phosphate synthetase-like amidotransferase/phosphosugar isomerase protein